MTDEQPDGADFGKPGWRYSDLPRVTKEYFDKYIEIIGAENIQWLTISEYEERDQSVTCRGQHLISPDGINRAKAWLKKLDKEHTNDR